MTTPQRLKAFACFALTHCTLVGVSPCQSSDSLELPTLVPDIALLDDNDNRAIAANAGEVLVGSHFGRMWATAVDGDFPDKLRRLPFSPEVGLLPFAGESVATTGSRSYMLSDEGFVESGLRRDGSRLPATHHQTATRARNMFAVAASGDLMMVSGRTSETRTGFVEIYQTLPDLKLEQTLVSSQVPRAGDQSNFGYKLAASADLLVIGNQPDFENPDLILSIFERDKGSQPWEYSRHIRIPSRSQGHYDIDTDGKKVALLYTDPSGTQQIRVFLRNHSGPFGSASSIPRDRLPEAWATNPLRRIAIDQNEIVVSCQVRNSQTDGLPSVFHFVERNREWALENVASIENDRRDFGEYLAFSDGFAFASITQALYRYDIRGDAPVAPRFNGLPATEALKGSMIREIIEVKGDHQPLVVELLEGPDFLEITEDEGKWVLAGRVPTTDAQFFIRIKVTDGAGTSAFRTYSLKLVDASEKPLITDLNGEQDLHVGQGLSVQPSVEGREPMNYQWFKNGVSMPNQTFRILSKNAVSPEDSGSYHLEVRNVAGKGTSEVISIKVRPSGRSIGDWTTFGNSPSHSGHHPASLEDHTFVHLWDHELPGASQIHRAVIAEGRAFISYRDPTKFSADPRDFGAFTTANAYDLDSGEINWVRELGNSITVGPPSYHKGRVYIQRNALRGSDPGSQLMALNASNGQIQWRSSYGSQNENYESPVVTDQGIWMQGGEYGGLVGVELDGKRRFFHNDSQIDGWTPAYRNGRLFTWIADTFKEVEPTSGSLVSSSLLRFSGYQRNHATVPVITDRSALLRGPDAITSYDYDQSEIRWTKPFSGPMNSLAVAGDTVYAIRGAAIETYDFETGSRGPDIVFPETLVSAQPLLLNSHLIAASDGETYIVDLATSEIIQNLPRGGLLSYSNGYLVVSGRSGKLSTFFANLAPVVGPDFPIIVESPESTPDSMFKLGLHVLEPDEGDLNNWTIVSVSRPEVFQVLNIDEQSGDLEVVYNPWQSGSSELVISIIDSAGNTSETSITFTVPALPLPELELAATLQLNHQTGLYEHSITITNPAAREIAGFDLTITGLPAGVCVNNASDCEGDLWQIEHRQPLAAGASVTLILEYFAPVRGTVLDPKIDVTLVTEPESDPAADDAGLAVDRCILLDDGLLIEFNSQPGALYEIQYSNNATDWKVSPVRIRAAGNRVQWIDRGPPRTDVPPADKSSRFYRVREVDSIAE